MNKSKQQYRREYYQKNKEKELELIKQYQQNHKKEIAEYRKQYDQNHKEIIAKQKKRHYQKHKESINEHCKQYYNNHKEQILEHCKQYYQSHKEQYNEYVKQKRNNDMRLRINSNMSNYIRKQIKNNKNGRHWEDLVGYTIKDLIKHLKKTMPNGYTWQDYLEGRLHIDHIVPISVFNFTSPEHIDFKRCWALENLQLLPAEENWRKYNKLAKPFQPALEIVLKE